MPSLAVLRPYEWRRVVRKNSLFVGNPSGGRTAAILASLTSTCRRHDIDPQLYLTQLLTNLAGSPDLEVLPGSLTSVRPSDLPRCSACRTLQARLEPDGSPLFP